MKASGREKRILRLRGLIADAPTLHGEPRFFRSIEVERSSGLILNVVPCLGHEDGGGDQGSPDPDANADDVEIVDLPTNGILVPGFVDCHVHAPQFPFHGTGLSRPLMAEDGFLHGHAFPTERAFRDADLARKVYPEVVRLTLEHGTTTAAYYGSCHGPASLELAKACQRLGQRALVGMVQLDQMMNEADMEFEGAPEGSEDTEGQPRAKVAKLDFTSRCLRETESFLTAVLGLDACDGAASGRPSLVRPVLTPRFVPSCSRPLLEGLGRLLEKYPGMMVQTHVQESTDEVRFAAEVWNEQCGHGAYESDLQVCRDVGLLCKREGGGSSSSSRLISAHGVHIRSACEKKILSEYRVGIAHCPLSNFYFADGLLDVVEMAKHCEVGLATDVAGGYSPSMLGSMRHAVTTGKVLRFSEQRFRSCNKDASAEDSCMDPVSKRELSIFSALHLATLGGSRVCGLNREVGLFDVSMEFDAVLLQKDFECLDLGAQHALPHNQSAKQGSAHSARKILLERLLHLADDRHVTRVWVRGRLVSWKGASLQDSR